LMFSFVRVIASVMSCKFSCGVSEFSSVVIAVILELLEQS
jgi:hypothetical protein